ncbi:MAG: DUF1800 family protein, partial [Casimicrobium sp.]
AFNATAPSGRYRIWNLEDPITSLGPNPMRSPSVFNFYRPDYAPPGAILERQSTAPEFQITHETTVTSYANFIVTLAEYGYGYDIERVAPDYTRQLSNANNTSALLAELNLLLAYGQLTPQTQQIILNAVNALPGGDSASERRRVQVAVALVMLAPEFLVQR